MIVKLHNCKGTLLFAVLSIMALLGAIVLTAAGQGISGQGINTSGPDSAYCTGNGYLYTTKSGVNSGKAICQFPDGTWCDAHAYFTGDCAASTNVSYNPNLTYNPNLPYNLNLYNTPVVSGNPYIYNNPYRYNDPQGALDIADATKTCQKSGGVVQRVHTSYGDVNMCGLPRW